MDYYEADSMSTPPSLPQAELLDRPFAFFPPICGVSSNEWMLVEATWSDMLVRNVDAGFEVAIPRGFLGQVSDTDKPVRIVGLTQELEYKTGAVWPVRRRVLEMKPSPLMRTPQEASAQPAPIGISAITGVSSDSTDSKIGKLIGVSFVSLLLLLGAIWAIIRFTPETKPTFIAKDQAYLELTREDDFGSVMRKLGPPVYDRWKSDSGELQYRGLFYKDRGYAVILMGDKRDSARYIGAMGLGADGKGWSPIHSIDFSRGASTFSLLKSLPRF
jgi:hypothetical protein